MEKNPNHSNAEHMKEFNTLLLCVIGLNLHGMAWHRIASHSNVTHLLNCVIDFKSISSWRHSFATAIVCALTRSLACLLAHPANTKTSFRFHAVFSFNDHQNSKMTWKLRLFNKLIVCTLKWQLNE